MTGARVLVVEDESIIAEDIQDKLKHLGYTVPAAVATGEEAIRAAEQTRPDIVLMDVRLRGPMDGIAAAAQIRERLRLPVIYLTAHSDDATLQRAKNTEPFGYLLKPFADQELRATVEMALYKHAMERRLQENEQKLATTLRSIGDALIATDADGKITFMNPVAEALTRWPAREAAGLALEQVFQIVDEATRQTVESPATKVLRAGVPVGLTNHNVLIARDGTEVPIDDSAAPIHDDQQKVHGVVLVFRDLTERRKAEEALRRAEEQLRQAQKMEAISRLAGGVAHDVNNMMTVVIGCSDIVLGRLGPDDPLRQLVEQTRQAGERVASTTRQLMAFARKQLMMPAIIDLNAVVRSTEEMLRRVLTEDIELDLLLAPDLHLVKADWWQMVQVLLNLALNSRDAMANGGKLIVETRNVVLEEAGAGNHRGAPPGLYVALAVRDTGCGMDETTRAHLFEPFFTTKDVGKGTGLGLASVYGIVKQSGGSISVDSEPGRGTAFNILLPPVQGPTASGATGQASPPASEAAQPT